MVLKQEIVEAFETLGISVDADRATATKIYKRLALIHHPDRNRGDSTSTLRFQQIGAAWNICQRHFDNPAWSHSSASSAHTYHFNTDDDIPLDEELLHEFYLFMFAETLFDRYSRAKGQRYRYERSGAAGTGLSTFSGDFAISQHRQVSNADRQRKEKEAYEKRMRELERETEEEARELEKSEKNRRVEEERRASAMEHAFQAAFLGNSSAVQKNVIEFDLDVNAPRKRVKQAKQSRRQEDKVYQETLLHAAASQCDETLVMFLVERGAKPSALNKQQLSPFHVAILAGNTRVVHFIMERRGKSFDGYHPSKAAPSGRTPLQLAISSGVTAMVELFIKDATTHDVERCWKTESVTDEIRDVLRMKKGFVIPEQVAASGSSPPVSKKLQRRQEIMAMKESRIVEEHERAVNNLRKKEERAAKRTEERRQAAIKLAEERSRRKAESEERQRLEEHRRIDEEREQALQAEKARALEEKLIQQEREAQALKEELIRDERETQARLMRERLEQEKASKAEAKTAVPIMLQVPPLVSSQAEISVSRDEERKAERRAKMKEKRKVKQAQRYREEQDGDPSSKPVAKKLLLPGLKTVVKDMENLDEISIKKMRRRAGQSARDKERHRRALEEKAKARETEYMPPTPVSTHGMTRLPEYFMEDIQTCVVPDYLFVV